MTRTISFFTDKHSAVRPHASLFSSPRQKQQQHSRGHFGCDERYSCAGRGRLRLDGRIIVFADLLVSVRVMLVGGLARPRKPGGSGVETPAKEVWTSSSVIPVQAYRTDEAVEAVAVTSRCGDVARRWRRRRGWGVVPREGLQGLLSSTALREPDPFDCGRPCDPAGRVPAVQDVRVDGAPDILLCSRDVPTVQTEPKTTEIPQVLFRNVGSTMVPCSASVLGFCMKMQ